MKISNLLNKDLKIVEKKKIFFIVPAIIVVLTIVAMIIYGSIFGSPLNLGMDFQGGYTINVKLSTKLTADTEDQYTKDIISIIENLKDKNGNPYGVKVSSVTPQGSNESAALYVRYKAVADEKIMEEEINPAIQSALQDQIFKIIPSFSSSNGKVTLNYGSFHLVQTAFKNRVTAMETAAKTAGVTVSDFKLDETSRIITFNIAGSNKDFEDSIVNTMSIPDFYAGSVEKGDIMSATVSSELLINAILAVCLAITLMLIYIAFRFEVSSGVSAVVALFHDILMMFCFMIIFRVEINSTFIAALITILGYSINNTIIIFDRIRENVKSVFNKHSTAATIANRSVRDTLMRSINTTLTTLITILMVAIIGVPDIRIFAFPIIIGLLSGTFSSICIAPSVWSMWKDRKRKPSKNKIGKIDKIEKLDKIDKADKVVVTE